MKGTNIGEFEELVLLTVATLQDEAYSIAIADEIKEKTNRSVVHSVVHSALHRLANKGFVTSEMKGATQDRGGRRKRIFTITQAGMLTLETVKYQRDQFWKLIPKVNISS